MSRRSLPSVAPRPRRPRGRGGAPRRARRGPGRPSPSAAGSSTRCSSRTRRGCSSTSRPPSPTCGRCRRATRTSSSSIPLKSQESVDTVIPELAERWSWQDNYRNLVFFLRKNVKWHDGKPVHLPRRQVHLRRGPRGAGRAGQAPAERAQGLVRQRRGHRGARALHGGVPAQAPAAVAPSHARLRLLARVPGPRAARRAAPALRRHRALPHEAVRCAASSSSWSATPTTSCRTGPISTASATRSSASGAPASPRSRPAASTPSCRSR